MNNEIHLDPRFRRDDEKEEQTFMKEYLIQVDEELCTFCRRCQLGCSNAYLRVFNPDKANIRIEVSGLAVRISFADECRKCGICVDHCLYGALETTARGAA